MRGRVTVNDTVRGAYDQESKRRGAGRRVYRSGVCIQPAHLPGCLTDRYGVIKYFAYVQRKTSKDWTLVARVRVFKRQPNTSYGMTTIDPRKRRSSPFFILVRDLGRVVAYAPVAMPGDGENTPRDPIDFWNRRQIVIPAYDDEYLYQ